MSDNYWGKYWSKQTNRRRLLGGAGVAGAGIAALGLVGCGDDDNGGGGLGNLATPTSAAGAKPTAVDPFAGAKTGGTYRDQTTAEPPSIDPYGSASFTTKVFSCWVYSRLMMYKTGPGIPAASTRPTGDSAETMEISPDVMKYTFKLRKGLKFHDVAPVSGRAVTTDDVKFSYGRATEAKNPNQGRLTSTIDKVEYPDASTIVMSLKAPDVTISDLMADANLLWIMPTESGTAALNPATKAIGSGPWLFKSYTPSVGFKFDRNPAWWNQPYPLMAGVEYAIIPDYPTRLAQFLAGNTDIVGVDTPDDLGPIKDKIKGVQLYGGIAQLVAYLYFDGNDPANPWTKDDRVRQAISMAQDRDALLDLGYNLKKLKAAGIDVKGPWNNVIPAGMTRFWLDPQSKDMGDSAKYFKYDPQGAKELLKQAGYPDGFSTTYQYSANAYGKAFNDTAEAVINFTNAIGVKTTTDVQDYSSKYLPQTFQAGNFKGMAYGYETPFPEASGYVQRLFTDNPSNHSKIKDSVLADLTKKQQVEVNDEKRKQILWDIQRENAKHMYYIPMPHGGGTAWSAAQPYLKNVYDFLAPGYGGPTETVPYVWVNK
jgi:ABC-type transport system substrate-binding protein